MSSEHLPATPLPSGQGGAPHSGAANGTANPQPEYGNYFVAAYPPFSQWTPEEVPRYRQALDQPIPANLSPPLGLYVHIPFCVERCRYCYYLSYGSDDRGNLNRYVDALLAELRSYSDCAALAARTLDFIYFGGGTPSLLGRSALERLFGGLKSTRPWSRVREVTFECAPKSVTPEKIELLRECGVTRLSLGVQQLDDEVLRRNGRVHLCRDVERAYRAVRAVDFPVVNLDLMVGMVAESRESMSDSLERVIALDPDSVTLYPMEIPLNTPLYRDLQSGKESAVELANWTEKSHRLAMAFEALAQAGYRHISAYAMVKNPARHDFIYQRKLYHGADLLGIGASAFGYIQGVHHQNAASLRQYTELIQAEKMPSYRAYALNVEERLVRELVLQLKLGSCSIRTLRNNFGIDVRYRFRQPLEQAAEAGWLVFDEERIELTLQGLTRVDHLIPSFYQPQHHDVRYS